MSDLTEYVGTGLLAAIAGAVVGWIHFRSLEAVSKRLVAGQLSAVFIQMARLVVLTLFFFVCARFGALPLLAAAAGLFIGRAVVLRGAARRAS